MTAAHPSLRRVVEAAPARRRIGGLAILLAAGFAALGAQASWVAITAPPPGAAPIPRAAAEAAAPRADLVDRNGLLLAASVPSVTLAAVPARVDDPAAVARALAKVLPGLDAAAAARRMAQRDKGLVYLRRGLSPRQRDQLFALGLPGIEFIDGVRRFYPQGRAASHALGAVDAELNGVAGLERSLEAELRAAAAAGRPVRLSLDMRVQAALDAELDRAARETRAKAAAGIVLDGRSGETLALASWPPLDANDRQAAPASAQINHAVGAVYELGSTIKPLVLAAGLDAGVVRPASAIDVSAFTVDGVTLRDPHPIDSPAPLRAALAHSSNMGFARMAVALGPDRMRDLFDRAGLSGPVGLELGESARPLIGAERTRLATAVFGYGHGVAVSPAAVAAAYTVFCNEGRRVTPTLLARAAGDPAPRSTPAFSPEAIGAVLPLMRAVVEEGTGRQARVAGLALAGKTGTAEKPGAEGYDSNRQVSSFAAVFPAEQPRYVIVIALDEPDRGADGASPATGGATAAPAAGRLAGRIAPLLGGEAEGREGASAAQTGPPGHGAP